MKPTRQTLPKEAASYFRFPGPKDPSWLATVLEATMFFREEERRRKENERLLYLSKYLSKSRSTGLKGSPKSSSSKSDEVAKATLVKSGNWYVQDGYEYSMMLAGLDPKLMIQSSIGDYRKYEKRSGAMTDQVQPVPGLRVITTTSTSGNPPKTESSLSVQSVTAWQKILDLTQSVDGDHSRPNPHRFRVRRINYGSGRSFAGNSRNNTTITGSQAVAFGLSATYSDQSTFAYNKAINKLYEQIRGDVDLSVDAFQARQSGMMVNQRFKQARELFIRKVPFALVEMVKIVTRMRRSNPRDWGSLWLEFTYGWKPLAGSIFGAADQMVKVATSSGVRSLPVRSTASEVGDSRVSKTTNGDGSWVRTQVESIYQTRITAHFAMLNSRLNAVAGLTSLNPVSIAWELVPYSFVADWIVDIGGYLRNMESSLLYRSDFTGGYTTNRSKERVIQYAGGGNNEYIVEAKGDSETLRFQRTVQTSSPMPRPPSFNPKLGTSRLISAASLLSQQLRSFKR